MTTFNELQGPIKDEDAAHPVAPAWRQTLREVIKALARGDYVLGGKPDFVAPVSAATARQIEQYIASYGETLIDLPDEAWSTSVSQWTGTHWDLLVDLWTEESGQSDMVLDARVFEVENGFRFEVVSVHVP